MDEVLTKDMTIIIIIVKVKNGDYAEVSGIGEVCTYEYTAHHSHGHHEVKSAAQCCQYCSSTALQVMFKEY